MEATGTCSTQADIQKMGEGGARTCRTWWRRRPSSCSPPAQPPPAAPSRRSRPHWLPPAPPVPPVSLTRLCHQRRPPRIHSRPFRWRHPFWPLAHCHRGSLPVPFSKPAARQTLAQSRVASAAHMAGRGVVGNASTATIWWRTASTREPARRAKAIGRHTVSCSAKITRRGRMDKIVRAQPWTQQKLQKADMVSKRKAVANARTSVAAGAALVPVETKSRKPSTPACSASEGFVIGRCSPVCVPETPPSPSTPFLWARE